MTFGREKRLLLGVLALLAPLPLPFNEVVGGWVYGVYAVCVGAFLWRARRGEERWLPNWAANLAAIAYLPVFALDLSATPGGLLVGPVLRLGLFAVVLKLFSLRRERDKWHAVFGIFFLFLAAAATSVHLSVAVFLVAFLGVGMLLLARFALLHLLAGFGRRDGDRVRAPMTGFLVAAAVATAVVSLPLFAVLPRVKTPYVYGPGMRGAGAEIPVTGYSDEVTLDSIGRVRESRDIVLRLEYGEGVTRREIRLKGGTFERYLRDRWLRTPDEPRSRRHQPDGPVALAAGIPVGEVEIFLQPLGSKALPVPVEALAVEGLRPAPQRDHGGGLGFHRPPERPLEYAVRVGAAPVVGAPPPEVGSDAPTLDQGGVTPRMAAFASTVAGSGPLAEKAVRLERYLIANYDYTLELVGDSRGDPIESFLFDHRAGNCEYFASSLVLLLRSQGIHARLVAGFLGGDRNALGYYAVRQSNAHVWVEAWIPDEGWRILDPTPPEGRPTSSEAGLWNLGTQLYDSMLYQWDRYVLSYGVDDQAEAARQFLLAAFGLWRRLRSDGPEAPPDQTAAATPEESAASVVRPADPSLGPWIPTLLTALGVALALLAWRRIRPPLTATHAYRRLRRGLAAAGLPVAEATGPLALARAASALRPAAAPAGRIVGLYVRESFGGESLGEGERRQLREALREARRGLRAGR